MGRHTDIQWADSTLNPMMGCAGCELWIPKLGIKKCYAGNMVERFQGKSHNVPANFNEPQLYLHRFDELDHWGDLTGKPRPATSEVAAKPWLDGMPRLVFMCDMGDPFTEPLPLDWLAPYLERLGKLPHILIWLTKSPRRMREFSEKYGPFPDNFWLLTSVTRADNMARIAELIRVKGGSVKGVSYEPAAGWVDFTPWFPYINWIIIGGCSGPVAAGEDPWPFKLEWARDLIQSTNDSGVAPFFKQTGANAYLDGRRFQTPNDPTHGGDWQDWPEWLRQREYPLVSFPRHMRQRNLLEVLA